MANLSEDTVRSLLRRFALLNSIAHQGRAENSAVIGRFMAEKVEFRNESRKIGALVTEVVGEINQLGLEEQREALRREFPDALMQESNRKKDLARKDSLKKGELSPIPGAVQHVFVTRFPPEPNGYMHIGHAKAAIIGSEYAKYYEGKFIIRFDDTNPAAEKKEFYGAFLDDLTWLDIHPDIVRNASDDMELFYKFAEKMISESTAYVCLCTQEIMREKRAKGLGCEHRGQSAEMSMLHWHKMLKGETERSGAVLRFVGDMRSENTTMRDPVLFRIVEEPHPLQGTRYRVWPTYDFDGPVEDSLDGVTHAMRSKEYELRDELYHAILKSLQLREPEIIEFSRLALQNTTVSKRSLRKLIEEGKVEGWDDPRLPTISGLRRRGILPESIREFILSMGLSKVESEPTWDLLESINRRVLDPRARRYFFVPSPVRMNVKNAPILEVTLKNHPDREYGLRKVKIDGNFFVPSEEFAVLLPGKSVRLIEAYNVQIVEKKPDEIVCEYLKERRIDGIPKVQWVSASEPLRFCVKTLGPLLKGGEFNPESMKLISGLAESSVSEIPLGDIVQFTRFGFCRLDQKGVAILAHK